MELEVLERALRICAGEAPSVDGACSGCPLELVPDCIRQVTSEAARAVAELRRMRGPFRPSVRTGAPPPEGEALAGTEQRADLTETIFEEVRF